MIDAADLFEAAAALAFRRTRNWRKAATAYGELAICHRKSGIDCRLSATRAYLDAGRCYRKITIFGSRYYGRACTEEGYSSARSLLTCMREQRSLHMLWSAFIERRIIFRVKKADVVLKDAKTKPKNLLHD